MTDILKLITEKLHGKVTEANFEGANIVLYTKNELFFKEGESKIKEIVNEDLMIVDFDISTDNKHIAYHAFYVNDPTQLHLFDLSAKENQLS